jgi:hypothetical protein
MEDAPQPVYDQNILNDHRLNRVKKKKSLNGWVIIM